MAAVATIDEPQAKIIEPKSSNAVLDDLDFVKISIPENVRIIPKDLIESVKGKLFTPDQFYKYQEDQIKYGNKGNLLYALVGKNKRIEGFLWAEINQMDSSIFINTFSISKEYWHKGKAMDKAISFVEKLKSKHQAPRVFWISTNDKFFVKHGFKRSKNVLMEYNSN